MLQHVPMNHAIQRTCFNGFEYLEYLCESFSAPRTLPAAGPFQENTKASSSVHHLVKVWMLCLLLQDLRPGHLLHVRFSCTETLALESTSIKYPS